MAERRAFTTALQGLQQLLCFSQTAAGVLVWDHPHPLIPGEGGSVVLHVHKENNHLFPAVMALAGVTALDQG